MRKKNKPIRLLFITTHYIPDYHYGGIVESGSKLFKFLRRLGQFQLSTVSKTPNRVCAYIEPSDHCYKSIFFHRFAFSINAMIGLWKDIKENDIFLINGIFTFPVTLSQLYCVILKKPFIVASRGGLEPWCRVHKKWKKILYIKLITIPLMKKAKYVHVTSDEEEKNIRKLGFDNIINISNGIDIEEFDKLPDASIENKYRDRFIFLFLSRTDKEKGIDLLVEAYRSFCEEFDKKQHILFLVGPDNQGYLKRMSIDFERENIEYIPGAYGCKKIALIRMSNVVILPSYSENFGNIIAEALACERPVITTTGTPWSEIEKIGCGIYIGPNKFELLEAMKKMFLKTPYELNQMGCKGRKYILEFFNWETKAREIFNYLQGI